MKSAAAKKISAPLSLVKRVEALLIELDAALDDLAAEQKAQAERCGPEGGSVLCRNRLFGVSLTPKASVTASVAHISWP